MISRIVYLTLLYNRRALRALPTSTEDTPTTLLRLLPKSTTSFFYKLLKTAFITSDLLPHEKHGLLALEHNTSRLAVSHFRLYLIVPPFGLRFGVTGLFPGHKRLRRFAIVGPSPSNWNKLPQSLRDLLH